MKYTVSLSEAKKYSRRKRAGAAIKLLRKQVEKREGEKVSVAPDINHEIWKNGAKNPPTSLEVEVVEIDGELTVKLAEDDTPVQEQKGYSEEKEEEETETAESTSEDEEYEEALDGTVGEAKDNIEDLDNPDYERLLELEKEGKDRKTLKEFLESKIE
jgi:ribosomal protein L31E